jgi:hypothetical protein
MNDKCALCGESSELRDSHFVAKAVYKRFNDVKAEKSPLMFAHNGRAFPIDRQITKKLLCDKCEGIFSSKGEDYFSRVALPIKGMEKPEFLFTELAYYLYYSFCKSSTGAFGVRPSVVKRINSIALYYYAISIFWRAGQRGWPKYNSIDYPDGLLESMRLFLLRGESLVGYVVRILPTFTEPRHGFVMPIKTNKGYFFSLYQYDFYLIKDEKCYEQMNCSEIAPVVYVSDYNRVCEISEVYKKTWIESEKANSLKQRLGPLSWN